MFSFWLNIIISFSLWILGRIQSCGFLCILTVAFFLFLASAGCSYPYTANSLTMRGTLQPLPNLTYNHPYMWKFEETCHFGFYQWSFTFFLSFSHIYSALSLSHSHFLSLSLPFSLCLSFLYSFFVICINLTYFVSSKRKFGTFPYIAWWPHTHHYL